MSRRDDDRLHEQLLGQVASALVARGDFAALHAHTTSDGSYGYGPARDAADTLAWKASVIADALLEAAIKRRCPDRADIRPEEMGSR